MSKTNRRQFAKTLIPLGLSLGAQSFATPLDLPIGLQLGTVDRDCQTDLDGTLREIARIGYRDVEAYTRLFKIPAEDFRRKLEDHGIKSSSAHYGMDIVQSDWPRQVEYAHRLGLSYMTCSSLGTLRGALDGFRRAAEVFNNAAALCRSAGIRFCYHNHNYEFREYDGIVAYDELLRRTDGKLVSMELDCFWVTEAGKDPARYLETYPDRFVMLHIKDLKPKGPDGKHPEGNPFTEVGSGVIDWIRIFKTARKARVSHYFVEQDRCDRAPLESVRISYEYLRRLNV